VLVITVDVVPEIDTGAVLTDTISSSMLVGAQQRVTFDGSILISSTL
jgi:hypothetical protein